MKTIYIYTLMSIILLVFQGFIFDVNAQTYSITNVTWSDQVDQDLDGYTRSRTMNVTINASQNTSAILEIRAWLDGQSEALYGNTTSFAVFAGTYTYTVPIELYPKL